MLPNLTWASSSTYYCGLWVSTPSTFVYVGSISIPGMQCALASIDVRNILEMLHINHFSIYYIIRTFIIMNTGYYALFYYMAIKLYAFYYFNNFWVLLYINFNKFHFQLRLSREKVKREIITLNIVFKFLHLFHGLRKSSVSVAEERKIHNCIKFQLKVGCSEEKLNIPPELIGSNLFYKTIRCLKNKVKDWCFINFQMELCFLLLVFIK